MIAIFIQSCIMYGCARGGTALGLHRHRYHDCVLIAAFSEHSTTRLYRLPNAASFLIAFITHWFWACVIWIRINVVNNSEPLSPRFNAV